MNRRFMLMIAVLMAAVPWCFAQNEPDTGGLAAGIYGSGDNAGGGGAYLGIYDAASFRRIVNPGLFVDVGMLGTTRTTSLDGVFSVNYQSSYLLHRGADRLRKPGVLFVTAGYSRFFNNGNGVNYGTGLLWRFPTRRSFAAIRLEYREIYVPGWGRQPGIRVGCENLISGD